MAVSLPRSPSVLVAGAFGQGNPGDESVLDAFVAGLRGCDVAATTPVPSPAYTAVPPTDRAAVARRAIRSDLVIVTATALKQLHPSTGRPADALLASTAAMSLATRAAGKPLVLAGAGAGRIDGRPARLLARAVLGLAGEVILRDEESADQLRAIGLRREVRVASDVVWSLLPGGRAGPPDSGGCAGPVVLTLSHLAGGPALERSLAETIRSLRDRGVEVVAQPWQPGPDGAMLDRIAALAGGDLMVWPAPADVQRAAGSLAPARVVVGLRFHSLVAAATAGVPFVAVAHEPKLRGLARRLGQPAVSPSATGAEIIAAIEAAIATGPAAEEAVAAERRAATQIVEQCRRLAAARAGNLRSSLRVGRV